MVIYWSILAFCSALLVAALVPTFLYMRRVQLRRRLESARKLFHQRREWLEADFFTRAAKAGTPRGLAWVECDFENPVAFARERGSRKLRALVGVTIRFEAVEGGGMEDNPNVGNLRTGTAVFTFDGHSWSTDGRAVLNLNPAQTIERFQGELETVED